MVVQRVKGETSFYFSFLLPSTLLEASLVYIELDMNSSTHSREIIIKLTVS